MWFRPWYGCAPPLVRDHSKLTRDGIMVELFWNYASIDEALRGETRCDAVDMRTVGSKKMVELFRNYASPKHVQGEKHEKKGAIIPIPRLAY